MRTREILDRLEAHYGVQEPHWPTDPYLFIVWWHCGYPQSDANCARGWDALGKEIGVSPTQILSATPARLEKALTPGGMVPGLRGQRLKEVAQRVENEFGGDLRAGLTGPLAKVRSALQKFPGIAGPGADRIMLFSGIAPVAAVPSNCPQVLVRVQSGQEPESYSAVYGGAQHAIDAEIEKTLEARQRAYLLLKQHGQEICKRTKPKCEQCPIRGDCVYFARLPRR